MKITTASHDEILENCKKAFFGLFDHSSPRIYFLKLWGGEFTSMQQVPGI